MLAKEISRYLAAKKMTKPEIRIFDGKKVTKKDTREGFYLPEDRGFEKGATAAMILSAAYKGLRITGFGHLQPDNNLSETMSFSCWQTNRVMICDCSGGQAIEQITEQLLVMKNNCSFTLLLPCEKGLFTRSFSKGDNRMETVRKILREKPLCGGTSALKRRTAYTMLGNLIRLLEEKSPENWILWDSTDPLNYQGKKRGILPESLKMASLPFAAEKADIICVGAGGTGGNIVKEIIPLLLKNKRLTLTIVDGDRVEEKNLSRQAFSSEDIQAFKSQVLAEKIRKAYPDLRDRISAVTGYIDTVDQMPAAENYPVLIGAVDNHRARQVFVQWFQLQRDGLWIDSANEFRYGEIVVSIRHNGKTISPLRSDIFPEVLTDHSPSASELSCGAVNQSDPQHQLTNLVAAGTVVSVLEEAFYEKQIQGGLVYFEALSTKGAYSDGVYAKRRPLYTREVKAYA